MFVCLTKLLCDQIKNHYIILYYLLKPKSKDKSILSIFLDLTSLFIIKNIFYGVPIVAQRLTNPTSIHEDEGLIPGLAQWVKEPELP